MAEIRAEIRVYGAVQGVFFRGAARKQALALGLSGYAENLDDGSVAVVVEGEARSVERLVEWCRRGPPPAHVTRVDVVRGHPLGGFLGFAVR